MSHFLYLNSELKFFDFDALNFFFSIFRLAFEMKLLSSIISASHFFENVNALTDDEISAFGCREGIYYQYEKVASNGGIAINQRASGKVLFLAFVCFDHFR